MEPVQRFGLVPLAAPQRGQDRRAVGQPIDVHEQAQPGRVRQRVEPGFGELPGRCKGHEGPGTG